MSIAKINSFNPIIRTQQKKQQPAKLDTTLRASNMPLALKAFVDYNAALNKTMVSFGKKPTGVFAKALDFEDSVSTTKTIGINGLEKLSPPKYFRFTPDKYQQAAAKHIFDGKNTVVTAPTGTGKTLIAEYAINKNLAEGKTTFYTTPLKALSNQKYNDFCELFGKENVGLITGDTKINKDAPVKVMTTEIYRNMLLSDDQKGSQVQMEDLATVVYDEFHYMNDKDRGEVWETSIMYTPRDVQQVALSATAKNGDAVTSWMNRIEKQKCEEWGEANFKETELVSVPPEERHVPLKYFVFNPNNTDNITALTTEQYNFNEIKKASQPNAAESLTDKQKDVIVDIAKNVIKKGINIEPTVENGIKILSKLLSKPRGAIEQLESALVKKLGMDVLEAKRAAALLADKSESRLTQTLEVAKGKKGKRSKKSKKSDDNKQQDVKRTPRTIDANRLEELTVRGTLRDDKVEALKLLSKEMSNEGSLKDGLQQLKEITNGNEINPKDFKKVLINKGISIEKADSIAFKLPISKRIDHDQKSSTVELIRVLEKQNKLPAIFFKFSRHGCEQERDAFVSTGRSLLNEHKIVKGVEVNEIKEATKIIRAYERKGVYLGKTNTDGQSMKESLLSGVAVHHAGMMPGYKELVEELFQKKLLKAVFATETLAAGINMPARTTVMTQLDKYAGETKYNKEKKVNEAVFRDLNPSEFQQMSGRAGRRGIDPIGNVVIITDKDHSPSSIYKLVQAKPDDIQSNFKSTYGFISHFISMKQTSYDIDSAVEKSFMKDMLEAKHESPKEAINKMKQDFNKMTKVLMNPSLGYFEGAEGEIKPTLKGTAISKVRGSNEMLFTETLFNANIDKLKPEQLAAIACALTEGDDKNQGLMVNNDGATKATLNTIKALEHRIQKVEEKAEVISKPQVLNTYASQFVSNWAVQPDDDNSKESWQAVVQDAETLSDSFDEGDLFKAVNRTVDILNQMSEISQKVAQKAEKDGESNEIINKMKTISKNAKQAVLMLKKEPILEADEEIETE